MSHSKNHLYKQLVQQIQTRGPMTVAHYMQQCVEHYYATARVFGRAGDFITAPEISQMFGEMIAAWFVDVWMQMGKPEQVHLVELGPGRGTLMADMLRTLENWPEFKSGLTVHLVENSLQLRDLQKEALADYRVQWHDHLSSVPNGCCFIVANEFFDALPIHQYALKGQHKEERLVCYNQEQDRLYFSNDDTKNIIEESPVSISIVEEIVTKIEQSGGVALIIDYGYAESGMGDTLQAVGSHRYVDALKECGEVDLTAHVDFSALKKAAEKKVNVLGPVTQGRFLIDLGIEARAYTLSDKASNEQKKQIMTDLCRLVAPQEMGRLFKVLSLYPKNATLKPAGFGVADDQVSDD